MGKMLGGDEEKDPDAAKKEEERREALRQEEEERKAKYAKMEAEREAVRQGIRDKVGAAAARHRGPGPGWGCCLREGWAKPGWAAARPPPRLAEGTSRRAPRGGGGRGDPASQRARLHTLTGPGARPAVRVLLAPVAGAGPLLPGSRAGVLASVGQAPVAAPRTAPRDLEGRPFWRGEAGRPGAGPRAGCRWVNRPGLEDAPDPARVGLRPLR